MEHAGEAKADMFAGPIEAPRLSFGEKLIAFNWVFVLLISCLACVGAVALYSVAGGAFDPWAETHVIRYCLGLGLLFGVALTDIRIWVRLAYPVYMLALALLVAVPLVGVEAGGAKRWLQIGSFGFQPAELMKVALVLALARYYEWLPAKYISNPLALMVPVLMIMVPVGLVVMQPDLGTAVLFAAVGGGLLFLAGASWIYFVFGIVGVVGAIPFVWSFLHDYQKARVLTFIDPGKDPLGAGYHILQSKIAVGSGGVTGKGYMQGTQSQLNFLPEKHTDFIFTMFAEEMGFVGSVSLLLIYLLVLLSIVYMAVRCRSQFARLVAAGVGITLFVYVFINVAMVMGLVPVVGVPLPLVSYGGTSMITLMFGFGLVLNAHVHRRTQFRRHEIRGV
ncbi:MAG: rod shape-determining protein RodA [Hyphomicrobiaceae bacterium]|nr:rod shape-determining protein RodA [Hyphomicrobiaceae bacterium]